jgi:hypothetical protein
MQKVQVLFLNGDIHFLARNWTIIASKEKGIIEQLYVVHNAYNKHKNVAFLLKNCYHQKQHQEQQLQKQQKQFLSFCWILLPPLSSKNASVK